MSPAFAFVPRKVAKKAVAEKVKALSGEQGHSSSLPKPSTSSSKGKEKARSNDLNEASNAENVHISGANERKLKYTAKLVDEDHAILVYLALSDYALWSNPDLRRKMDPSYGSSQAPESGSYDKIEGDDNPADGDDGGFIPLSYLLHSSSYLSSVLQTLGDSQVPIIKSLRTYAFDFIDVRLLVAAPQPWFNRNGEASSSKNVDTGGYEIRRKDWATLAGRTSFLNSKTEWDKSTIYVENIPVQFRTIPAVAKFIRAILPPLDPSLVSSPQPSMNDMTRVQNVNLPPHHQDKPGVQPSCKGFALITFLRSDDAATILQSWPWDHGTPPSSSEKIEEAAKDAARFGFRTLGKTRWEALRAEYLLYRQKLVDEINTFQDTEASYTVGVKDLRNKKVRDKDDTNVGAHDHKGPPQINASSPPELSLGRNIVSDLSHPSDSMPTITSYSLYPYGCLVFVKNIHTETNKTTLKSLFGKAFTQASSPARSGGLDYVDFNKGMDTCYLRLSTLDHTEMLVSYFKTHPTVQTKGLDSTGAPLSEVKQGKAILMETVLGTREEVYWQKVPEKVRSGAVEKALKLVLSETNSAGGHIAVQGEDVGTQEVITQMPRKKRKR